MPPVKAKPKPKASEPEGFQFEILPARDLSPHTGIFLLVLGPPKVGKSYTLASFCSEGPTLLIATLQREATSWGYQEQNPDTILLEDRDWRPEQGRLNTDAFQRFLDLMDQLSQDDHYKVVIVDSGTELAEYAWRDALRGLGVGSPADFDDRDNRFRPYTKIADLMRQALDAMLLLKTAPLPKHVAVSWHLQSVKDDQIITDPASHQKVKKVSADRAAATVEYLGDVLPMMQGGFRRRIAGLADAVVFAHCVQEFPTDRNGKRIVGREKEPRYVLQVRPDGDRHAGIPGPMPPTKFLDVTNKNAWHELKALLPKHGK